MIHQMWLTMTRGLQSLTTVNCDGIMKKNLQISQFLLALVSIAIVFAGATIGHAQFTSSGAEQLSRGGSWSTTPDGSSTDPSAAPNGDIVAFASRASNLVAGDSNGYLDVFQYTPDKKIELISVAASAPPTTQIVGSSGAFVSSVLPDGAYGVAFTSDAPNLVSNYSLPPGEKINPRQVYLRLPRINKTVLVSRGRESTDAAVVGANSGCDQVSVVAQADPDRFIVAFRSAATNLDDRSRTRTVMTIFVVRVEIAGTEATVKQINAPHTSADGKILEFPLNNPVMSGDGRFVAFSSVAAMQEGQPTEGKEQVYVFDYAAGKARMISRNAAGAPGDGDSAQPSISYQGDFVAFITRATNLVQRSVTTPMAVLFSAPTKKLTQVNTSSTGEASNGQVYAVSVNPGGKLVGFADDGSNLGNVASPAGVIQSYLKDPFTGAIVRTSTKPDGTAADGNSGAHNLELANGENPIITALSLGGLGFNSRVVYSTFGSVAQNLKFTPSSDTFANIYRTTITPPKPRFAKNAPIEAPPDTTISATLPGGKGATVIFQMQELDDSTSSSATAGARVDQVIAKASSKARLQYALEIRKSGTKQRILRTSSRNTVTVRKLAPGSYTVRYRVVKTSGKTVTRTKYSPKGSLTIT